MEKVNGFEQSASELQTVVFRGNNTAAANIGIAASGVGTL